MLDDIFWFGKGINFLVKVLMKGHHISSDNDVIIDLNLVSTQILMSRMSKE